MSLFIFTCDACNKADDENARWFWCHECQDHICQECSTDHDEETGTATCKRCHIKETA